MKTTTKKIDRDFVELDKLNMLQRKIAFVTLIDMYKKCKTSEMRKRIILNHFWQNINLYIEAFQGVSKGRIDYCITYKDIPEEIKQVIRNRGCVVYEVEAIVGRPMIYYIRPHETTVLHYATFISRNPIDFYDDRLKSSEPIASLHFGFDRELRKQYKASKEAESYIKHNGYMNVAMDKNNPIRFQKNK